MFTFSSLDLFCKFCPKINLAFWYCVINLPVFYSQRLEGSGFLVTYTHGIYDLPHELPNDLRFRIVENYEISGKCLNPSAQSPCQTESFVNTSRKLLKNRNETYPAVRYVP